MYDTVSLVHLNLIRVIQIFPLLAQMDHQCSKLNDISVTAVSDFGAKTSACDAILFGTTYILLNVS